MIQPVVSFRDPTGTCLLVDGRVLRVVRESGVAAFEAFLRTKSARGFVERRQLVATRRLEEPELTALRGLVSMTGFPSAGPGGAVFEHERIWFPSYPYEWPPEMLWEAGRLTLEMALAALEDGHGLTDATPCNILFRGSEPVFIDVPSFESRTPGDPVWTPYGQFVRTFLLPLLANRRWSIPLADIFTTHRDGLEPERVYPWCGPLERFQPRILSLVSMPTWLRGRARSEGGKLYESRTIPNREKARFIVESLLKQLRRSLQWLEPPARKESVWSDYMATHSYSEPAFAAKERFVESLLREFKPSRALDVGANTGHFSALAARAGAAVVALDLDPACVGALWRRAQAEKLNVLPLVVDLSRPSPALGWRNSECPSFLDRAAGRFDAVLMLAVIHHLLVTERVPLKEILRLASELTTSLLVIEFVPPEDTMFRQLTRGRDHLHASLTRAVFETACGEHFDTINSVPLPGSGRRLYALKRKGGGR
jgi:2-polyprenyl-3-methyl-5-hydroxy-6-metoxy-1,4-benzoquinol methylase